MARQTLFKDLLQRRKISPPTARNFDETVWHTALAQPQYSSEIDLIRTGLWFAKQLQSRWRLLEDIGIAGVASSVLFRHIAGVANQMHLRTDAMLAAAALSATDGVSASMSSLTQLKLDIDGQSATADMRRTSTIDTLGKFTAYIQNTSTPQPNIVRLNEASMKEAYPIFEDIYLLDFLWGQIVWCGWRMGEVSEQIQFVRPKPDQMGESFVVAEYRREQLFAEFQAVFRMEWQHSCSILPAVWHVQVRKRDNGYPNLVT